MLEIGEHTGTHFDAPIHWISGKDGKDVASVEPGRLVGPAVVIDKSAECAEDPGYLLTVADFEAWEDQHGAIQPGSWVLFRSGWDARAQDAEAFLNAGPEGPVTPGPDVEAARWLGSERGITGFGVETVGIDAGAAGGFDPGFPVHQYLLGSDRYGLTQLANLGELPPDGRGRGRVAAQARRRDRLAGARARARALELTDMAREPFHEGSRALQDRFDTRRLADHAIELLGFRDPEPVLDDAAQELIRRLPMVFVGTADAEGRPHCSYKGGEPGFVRVLDPHTLALPDYNGNGMFDSWGNVAVNPHVDLLFIDFEAESPWRLRVKGVASIDDDDPLLAEYPGAQMVVRVRATRIYPVCPRYVHRMRIVEPSKFVPRADAAPPPPPEWKLDPADVPPRRSPPATPRARSSIAAPRRPPVARDRPSRPTARGPERSPGAADRKDKMDFGVFLPVSGRASSRGGLMHAAQTAEELGFTTVWAADRIVIPWTIETTYNYNWSGSFFVPPEASFLEALTVLSFLAGCTEKLKLGISVLVTPYRDPLYWAKIATTIDQLSEGRLILGFGVGWMEEEFKALGREHLFKARGRVADE